MNKRGFGLIELVICSAIFLIILLAALQLSNQQTRLLKAMTQQVDWIGLEFNILSTLNHTSTCTTSLVGQPVNYSSPLEIHYTDQSGSVLSAGVKYGSWKIDSVLLSIKTVLSPGKVIAELSVQAEKLSPSIGPPYVWHSFIVQLDVSSSNVIMGCY